VADLVNIKTFLYRHEAEMAKGLLDEENIEAMISADDLGGYRPHLAFGMGGVQLLVKKEDVEKAQAIIKVLEDSIENNFKNNSPDSELGDD